MDRPTTTLFMLMSVDGKISTGDNDNMDVDKDYKNIPGVKEGLHQYYELEMQTDQVSLNTGRVMAKIGLNERANEPEKIPVDFVILDNQPHLKESGVTYLSKWVRKLYLVTTNKKHPAIQLKEKLGNIEIIKYEKEIDLVDLFRKLKENYSVEYMTVQSGGTLNASLIRLGLIDHLSIVVAPLLVGGKNTSTLVDGESLHIAEDLKKVEVLKLVHAKPLENSYLHLWYDVIN